MVQDGAEVSAVPVLDLYHAGGQPGKRTFEPFMLALSGAPPNALQEMGGGELNPASESTGTGQLQRLLPNIQVRLVQLRPGVNDLNPFNACLLHALLE